MCLLFSANGAMLLKLQEVYPAVVVNCVPLLVVCSLYHSGFLMLYSAFSFGLLLVRLRALVCYGSMYYIYGQDARQQRQ